jgi:AraC family transcriptional regulator, activator of mtrCDE
MSAVYDPQIGRALMLIHGDVAAPWTVESLAAAVGMSRSRFAERFSQLVERGPMAYVAEWRLQRALSSLAAAPTPIKTVARSVGYRSAAAFTRAFTERFGCSPKERRRAA